MGSWGDLEWYDYGARWYDPAVGRMMQVDPLASSFDSWSTYNYGMDNPVRYVDPTGMFSVGFNQDDWAGEENTSDLEPEVTYTDLLPTVEVVATKVEKRYNDRDGATDVFFNNLERSYNNGDFSGGNADEPEFFPIIFALPAAISIAEGIFIGLTATLVVATTVDSANELIEDIIVASKGGDRNVWPTGEYPKPNPKDIDWSKGDSELADSITGSGVAKGGGTAWNQMKKWFNRKRKEINK
jgi:RHS repeat-associated protein